MPVAPAPVEPLTALRRILMPTRPRIRVLFNETCPFTAGHIPTSHYRVVFEFHDHLDRRPADDLEVLERQYRRFNIGDDDIALAYRRLRLRSLSVGDLVAVNDHYYSCDSRGWEPVPRRDVLLVTTDPRPPRHRRVYR